MDERRRSIRRRLKQPLKAVNLLTGEVLGSVLDITPEGILVKGQCAIESEQRFEIRLLLPVRIFGKQHLDIEACCVWIHTQEDEEKHLMAGFEFTEVTPQDIGIILGIIMDQSLTE